MLPNLREYTEEQLWQIRQATYQEEKRRKRVEEGPEFLDEITRANLTDEGVTEGDPWRQPTGALDAYPRGWTVTHDGKTWRSTTPGNVWEPGVSGWREQVPEGQDPPEWVQPTGAHDAYGMGERVTHDSKVWFSTRDVNVWAPPEGWAMEDPPEQEPDPGTGEMPWEAGMSYAVGDLVSYEGIVYECRQAHTAQTGWEPPNIPALWIAA